MKRLAAVALLLALTACKDGELAWETGDGVVQQCRGVVVERHHGRLYLNRAGDVSPLAPEVTPAAFCSTPGFSEGASDD